ncbi:hypothetical protein GSI_14646 [Ganoderma sinense ZZ0214-1]|uniref:Uncharacterized protein n=1 Tax=Ganoderma sinense ZZ0214-1 TaxID=1077348 RepID=A0A2G8RP86_9APHY|nr:hypothetical protein GSI_14646 [Ganoderma sinense ZZ0214-1]
MLPQGLVIFEYIRKKRTNDSGVPLADASQSTLLEEWQRLPEKMKVECEKIEAHIREKKRAVISMQQSSPSPSTENIPAGSTIPDVAASPAATQHFSSPSPSTTPSPSTPLLSPSPFYSPQPAHHYPQDLFTAPPTPSQPGPLNIGDNWPSVEYGASPKVAFLMENQPSLSSGGRQMATNHNAHPHPYAPAGTIVPVPHLHGGQARTAQIAPLRRTQTVVLAPAAQTTPSTASVPSPVGNLRRFHTAPSLATSSNPTHVARVVKQPLVHAVPATPSGGHQPARPPVRDRSFSAESVEGLPLVPTGVRQPPPSPPYASVAPASPAAQVLAPTPILGSPRVYAHSVGHHVHTTAADPLLLSIDQPLPAETDSTTATAPVAPVPQELDLWSWQPLNTESDPLMKLLREIPTPPPDMIDFDFAAYLDDIIGPQMPVPALPEDDCPLPDVFQIWTPGHWSEGLLSSSLTGWNLNDFTGSPAQ